MEMEEDGSVNPRSSLALSVSDRDHHCQENDDTEGIPLIHTYFQGKWRGQPITRRDGCREPRVPGLQQLTELWWSMVAGHRKLN